jgi:hypothetical protein
MSGERAREHVPWWKPTLDSQGRLVTSKKPVGGVRRFAEEFRNALVLVVLLGALVQAVGRDIIVTGIVIWVVFLGIFWLGIRGRRRRPTSESVGQAE